LTYRRPSLSKWFSLMARRGATGWRLVDVLLRQPVIDTPAVARELGVTSQMLEQMHSKRCAKDSSRTNRAPVRRTLRRSVRARPAVSPLRHRQRALSVLPKTIR
jgi:hypothetical protein